MTIPSNVKELEYWFPEVEKLFEEMTTLNGLNMPWTDFNPVQLDWFLKYAPQEWIDYYYKMLEGSEPGGGGGGGGGTVRG